MNGIVGVAVTHCTNVQIRILVHSYASWSVVLNEIERHGCGIYCAPAKTTQFDNPFHPVWA